MSELRTRVPPLGEVTSSPNPVPLAKKGDDLRALLREVANTGSPWDRARASAVPLQVSNQSQVEDGSFLHL